MCSYSLLLATTCKPREEFHSYVVLDLINRIASREQVGLKSCSWRRYWHGCSSTLFTEKCSPSQDSAILAFLGLHAILRTGASNRPVNQWITKWAVCRKYRASYRCWFAKEKENCSLVLDLASLQSITQEVAYAFHLLHKKLLFWQDRAYMLPFKHKALSF